MHRCANFAAHALTWINGEERFVDLSRQPASVAAGNGTWLTASL